MITMDYLGLLDFCRFGGTVGDWRWFHGFLGSFGSFRVFQFSAAMDW